MAKNKHLDEYVQEMLASLRLRKKMEKQNGKNRRARQARKSSSLDQSNPSPGGSGAQGTNQGTSIANLPPATSQGTSVGYYGKIAGWPLFWEVPRKGKWAPPWMPGELGKANQASPGCRPHLNCKENKLSTEGILAGEIIAYRAWYWEEESQRLRSLFVDYEWPLTAPATGEPANGYGIHAFKSLELTWHEYAACAHQVIFGKVALWGDVIEHEGGYRAEFGKVHELFDTPSNIRELYLP